MPLKTSQGIQVIQTWYKYLVPCQTIKFAFLQYSQKVWSRRHLDFYTWEANSGCFDTSSSFYVKTIFTANGRMGHKHRINTLRSRITMHNSDQLLSQAGKPHAMHDRYKTVSNVNWLGGGVDTTQPMNFELPIFPWYVHDRRLDLREASYVSSKLLSFIYPSFQLRFIWNSLVTCPRTSYSNTSEYYSSKALHIAFLGL